MQYQQQKQASNGFAITSLVLGIIGVVLNIIVLLPYLLGTLAIVFGVIGVKNQHGKGMAIAGLTLGIIALSMKLIFWFFIFFSRGSVNTNNLKKLSFNRGTAFSLDTIQLFLH